MKRWSLILIAMLLSLFLVACGGTGAGETTAGETDAPTSEAPATDTQATEPEGTEPEETAPEETEPEETAPDGDTDPEVHVHSLTHVPKVLPGCDTEGCEEYWKCKDCASLFSDAKGEKPLEKLPVLASAGHAWDEGQELQALTCTADGEYKHTCTVCGISRTVTVSTGGHDWDKERTCEEGHSCLRCFTSEPALTHDYRVTDSSEGTCAVAPFKTYTCANEGCGDSYTDVLGAAIGHDTAQVTPTEKQISGCEYVLIYVCKTCGEDVEGDRVVHHAHKASITKAATCGEDGIKTLTCACGDSYTLPIEKNATGHAWKTGEVKDGKRTDTCELCGSEKSVTVVVGDTTGKTNASELANTEIEVNQAGVTLDQGVIDAIGDKEVTLSVGKFEGDDRKNLGIDAEKLAQVGDSPIYDFTIHDGEKNISEFGEENFVTITVPYTLSEGEDVDSIAIWFINDKGELETIDAVYNNGSVTFKTNHFSYYTVTRLTPAQRCEAWGHNYIDTKAEASCTRDGYTLSICTRCHHTVKTVTETAWGHKYTESVTPATCTVSGAHISVCEACGDSYASRIPATGHLWVEGERRDASCTENGYVLYVCDNADCKSSYREILPLIKHSYEVNTVAPTCTEGGYTVHTCASCKLTWKDSFVAPLGHKTVSVSTPAGCETDGYTGEKCERCDYGKYETVPALGHDYKAEWEWNVLRDGATLHLTCARDASHAWKLSATVDIAETPAECGKDGLRTYTATAEHDGVIYTDVKETVIPARKHEYGIAYKYHDDTHHWKDCVYCGAPDPEKLLHDFGEWETVLDPTCIKAGERRAVCLGSECGYTKTEAIPATGEHSYTDGVCGNCGKIEENVGCDHILAEKVLDLGESGACTAILHYFACDCGEVVKLPEETTQLKLGCELSPVKMEMNPEDGSYVMEFACTECGLVISVHGVMSRENCVQVQDSYYTFLLGETVLLENAFLKVENEAHSHRGSVTLELSEYGFCGGGVEAYPCGDCGKILEVGDIHPTCMAETVQSTYRDAEGNEHTVYTLDCADCPMVLTQDHCLTVESPCESSETVVTAMKKGDEVIFEIEDTVYRSSHAYGDPVYTLLGKTCTDGVKVSEYCPKCKDTVEREIDRHPENEWVSIALDDMTPCGGFVDLERCVACGVAEMANPSFGCDFHSLGEEEMTDDNGILHILSTDVCTECGMTLLTDMWFEALSACEELHYESVQLLLDGKVIAEWTTSFEEIHHNYEYEYRLEGESCGGSYSYSAKCSVCNDTLYGGGFGHPTATKRLNLSEHGFCGGQIHYQECRLCGLVTWMDKSCFESCAYGEITETEETDENGIYHRYESAVCATCGIRYGSHYSSEKIEGCNYRSFEEITLTAPDGTVLLACTERGGEYSSHTWSYSFSEGASCHRDDYEVHAVCTVCGEEDSYRAEGHFYAESGEEHDLGALGACGGYIYSNVCTLCGDGMYEFHCDCWFDIMRMDEYTDENGIRHDVRSYTCENCGFTYREDDWSEPAGQCQKTVIRALEMISPDGSILVSVRDTDIAQDHDVTVSYLPKGESCETDGYLISIKCSKCDYSEELNEYGCRREDTETDLKELGMCGGSVSVYACIICGDVDRFHAWDDWCDWRYDAALSAEWGCDVSVCTQCGTVRTTHESRTEKDAHCAYEVQNVLSYQRDGKLLAEFISAERYTDHHFDYSFKMWGESCEDGFFYSGECACGETEEGESDWHQTFERLYIDFAEYGACGGYLKSYACPCGEESHFDFELPDGYRYDETEFADADGTYHCVTVYSCDCCGLSVTHHLKETRTGCTVSETDLYSVRVGAMEVIFEEEVRRSTYEEHEYEYRYELHGESCEDGVSLFGVCAFCGDTEDSRVIHWHETYLTESVSLSEYGACYGSFEVYECPCGRDRNVYYDYCYTAEDYRSYTDEAGVHHEIVDYHCERCGLTVTRDRYTEKEGCSVITWHSYTATKGGAILVEGLLHRYAEYDEHSYTYRFEMYGESCEDGVTVYAVCDCGVTEEVYIDYHRQFTQSYLDLTEYGACYGYFSESACPCGKEVLSEIHLCSDKWWSDKDGMYNDENGIVHRVEHQACSKCGLSAVVDTWSEREGCYIIDYQLWTIRVGENTVVENRRVVSSIAEEHSYSYTFDMHGESCEDGFAYLGECACGATVTGEENWHVSFVGTRYPLSEYGACYGVFELAFCPCGQERYLNVNFCHTERKIETVTGADGTEHTIETYHCKKCGLSAVLDVYMLRDGCEVTSVEKWSMTFGGTVIFENLEYIGMPEIEHDYATEYELFGKTCEDGVRVVHTCRACGESYEENYDWHQTVQSKHISASEYGACYGWISFSICACGQERYEDAYLCYDEFRESGYTDENGHLHSVVDRTCWQCGLHYQRDSYTIRDRESCTETEYVSIMLSMNGTLADTLEYSATKVSHSTTVRAELLEGALSCEDGYIWEELCTDCGELLSSEVRYGHDCLLETVYTFADYGAVCDGILTVRTCPCGHNTKGEMSRMECSFEVTYTEPWIDGTVHYSDWYDAVCTATDPACGFAYRYARYYLPGEGCTAVGYECWVLGYNPATGEYKEMILYPTGEVIDWHNWVSDDNRTGEDALGAWRGTYTECTGCGRSSSEKYYFAKDGTCVYEIYERVEVNADGSLEILFDQYEYEMVRFPDGSASRELIREWNRRSREEDGYRYVYLETETVYTRDFTYPTELGEWGYLYTEVFLFNGEEDTRFEKAQFYANGRLHVLYEYSANHSIGEWRRYEYTYNPEKLCDVSCVYTDSFGMRDEWTENRCDFTEERLGTPTCSQSVLVTCRCSICGEESGSWEEMPYGHRWEYDFEQDVEYCGVCGLENAYGVNGDVIFEDMSDAYGDGENCVIGYFYWGEGALLPHVNIRPLDENGNPIEKGIGLDVSISEHETLRALVFSKEEVKAAAELLGYSEGSYYIALTLVPSWGEEFEYSIVLTGRKHKNPNADLAIPDIFA